MATSLASHLSKTWQDYEQGMPVKSGSGTQRAWRNWEFK